MDKSYNKSQETALKVDMYNTIFVIFVTTKQNTNQRTCNFDSSDTCLTPRARYY